MRCRDERGAATLLALALAGVLFFTGQGLAVLGGVIVAQREAHAAADLASLAGAAAITSGADPCATVAALARDNGAELETCRVSGREVLVGVIVTGPHPLGRRIDVTALARAGPGAPGETGP